MKRYGMWWLDLSFSNWFICLCVLILIFLDIFPLSFAWFWVWISLGFPPPPTIWNSTFVWNICRHPSSFHLSYSKIQFSNVWVFLSIQKYNLWVFRNLKLEWLRTLFLKETIQYWDRGMPAFCKDCKFANIAFSKSQLNSDVFTCVVVTMRLT